jgi:hypothetical protein
MLKISNSLGCFIGSSLEVAENFSRKRCLLRRKARQLLAIALGVIYLEPIRMV